MDKLENYLDQVCRSVGGPRALRQHLRQELREHLQDAVAQHKAAGLPEADALARALEEFGKPEDVRSELEATHGHRMMAVVIDKAVEWKEMTMKAKWLWTSWAYLAVSGVLLLEVLFLTFLVMFIVPKFQRLLSDGIVDPYIIHDQGVSWMVHFLNWLQDFTEHGTTWLVLGSAAAWGLFEWRVRSENKPFMRLSALGTASIALLVVIVLATGSLVICFCLSAPTLGKMANPFAREQLAIIDKSIVAIEQAQAKQDWDAMQESSHQAAEAMFRLQQGPALASLAVGNDPQALNELRSHFVEANVSLDDVRQAIRSKNGERLATSLQKFQRSFGSVRTPGAKAGK